MNSRAVERGAACALFAVIHLDNALSMPSVLSLVFEKPLLPCLTAPVMPLARNITIVAAISGTMKAESVCPYRDFMRKQASGTATARKSTTATMSGRNLDNVADDTCGVAYAFVRTPAAGR